MFLSQDCSLMNDVIFEAFLSFFFVQFSRKWWSCFTEFQVGWVLLRSLEVFYEYYFASLDLPIFLGFGVKQAKKGQKKVNPIFLFLFLFFISCFTTTFRMCLDKLRMHFSNVCYDYKTIKFVQIHVFLAQAKVFFSNKN